MQCHYYVNRDWFNTVGEAGASIVAEITRSDNTYTMNYTYYFIDIYEWAYHYDNDPLSWYFHSYHESGLAQEYLMKRSFSGSLSWEKGETAYMTGVLEQISDTLQYWQSESNWEDSNEYDRFIADVAERGITNLTNMQEVYHQSIQILCTSRSELRYE